MKRWWTKGRKRSFQWVAFLAVAVGLFFLPPLPPEYRDFTIESSRNLTDRNGVTLRRNLSPRAGVNSWVELEDMPRVLLDAVLLAEDRRFYLHAGADPIAMARAVKDNLRAGGVVSGASTITQQLLRTLAPAPRRNLWTKFSEIYWAVRLECAYSKDDILEAYLNRVAFGGSVHGAQEAARYYFGKPISAISAAEAAALAVTIRSPSVLDPFGERGQEELARWTGPLLDALQDQGRLSAEATQRAKAQALELSSAGPPFLAPHFCDMAQSQLKGRRGKVVTTLDLALQQQVEGLVSTHLALLREHNVGNAAVVVADVQSGEILALMGSQDFQHRDHGQHNAAISLRQPGSTIKPFTYALLLEATGQAGFILPDLDLYEDAERESFVPENYDKHFHGPVSIRTSLACSFNVPAVRALERVGTDTLLQLLRRSGFDDLTQPPEHYGLGLTLGDGSVSLWQLVAGYRAFATGGEYSDLMLFPDEFGPPRRRILSARSSYLVNDILSDQQARIASFGTPNSLELPFPCAVKTGTSKGYRDNWTIGYTPKHVVGVWVGNSDGSPMENVSGITGAGPLFRDVILTLGAGGEFVRPPGLMRADICTLSGQAANPHCPSLVGEWAFEEKSLDRCGVCLLEEGRLVFQMPSLYRAWARQRGLPAKAQFAPEEGAGLRFVFPQSGDVSLTDPDLRKPYQRVKFQLAGGSAPYSWQVDGRDVKQTVEPALWWELQPGRHRLEVRDSLRNSASIVVEVMGKLPRSS